MCTQSAHGAVSSEQPVSSGQRATIGAIERVQIDRDTLEPRFKCIGSDLWSDEPGFSEAMSGTGVTGICGSGIIEVIAEMYLAGIISSDGVVDGALGERTQRIKADGRTFSYVLHASSDPEASDVLVTQNDVRQIQLAKAALYAGIKLLMDEMGVTTVDRIRLAGAFGSHISVSHAMPLVRDLITAIPSVQGSPWPHHARPFCGDSRRFRSKSSSENRSNQALS